jgi:hypothetical protein
MQLAVAKWEILVAHDTTDRCRNSKLLHKRQIFSCRIPLATYVMNVKFEYFSVSVETISLNIST